jgi:hypothetical protein
MHGRTGIRAAVLGAGAIALALTAGCGPMVKPQTSEKGAPTLTWTVLDTNTGQSTTYYTARATITWSQGDQYFIVFKANDPGGIKSISLGGGEEWQCVGNNVAQTSTADEATQSVTFSPSSNGLVGTYQFLPTSSDPGLWTCNSGFSFDGGSAAFEGKAANFANKSATATLTIVRSH